MNTGCFSLGSTSRFLLVRFFAVASIIGVGDIGAGFSDESLADKSLARTQQRSIVAAGSARTALNPGGTARFFTINEILDKSDRPAALPVPVPNDEPFGMTAFVQPEGQLATKWHEIQVDLAEEEPILKECVADESKCTSAAARFVAIVMNISQQIGRARLELANQQVNSAIRYKTDAEQWGVADRWSTPLQTFATGFGDCEDYAIAKYVALRQSGVPASDLRMVLGYDSRRTGGQMRGQMTGHAVLAARSEGSWLVLDNLAQRPWPANDMPYYAPLFVFDTRGVNMLATLYIKPSLRPSIVALETVGSSGPRHDIDLPARARLIPARLTH
jgi:predicted transglutaminase-like cysteine proteinase